MDEAITAEQRGVRAYNDARNLARHLQNVSVAELARFAAALQAEASARGLLGAIAPLGAAVSELEDAR